MTLDHGQLSRVETTRCYLLIVIKSHQADRFFLLQAAVTSFVYRLYTHILDYPPLFYS